MSETVTNSVDFLFEKYNFAWREPHFRNLCKTLLEKDRPLCIVETGCMRPPCLPDHEFEDGQSTLVWDLLARITNGRCITIDINPQNIEYAKERVSNRTDLICGDSIPILSTFTPPAMIDLLYLDSMDLKEGVELDSALHHAGELAAAWKWVPSGGIVAVDDCVGPFIGKHALIRCYFEILGNLHPRALGNISWWERP